MKKQILGPYIIGSALILGLTIVGVSLRMQGLENKAEIMSLLSGGACMHLILIWGPLAVAIKKLRGQDEDQSE